MQSLLLLEDGTTFAGTFFAAPGIVVAEVVFNTSMSGYQEVLSDPSYTGQIVVMTAPQIGNTGVNARDMESDRVQVAGFVVREISPRASSWRAEATLPAMLEEHGVPGLTGIDTRALTRHVRSQGAMKGIIAPAETSREELARRIAEAPSMQGLDLASRVTCAKAYEWSEGEEGAANPIEERPARRVVVMDFGVKRSILRRLVDAGLGVTVVPAHTSAEEILALRRDGILLSNGPGDPAALPGPIDTVKQLLGKRPIFGICLGHQVLALALGGRTFKLKFGHRGSNHPVRDPAGGQVCITAQNHGFAVAPELPVGVEVAEINLSDGTVEGIACPHAQAFSVQYHPEAGPGPRDATGYFARFSELIESTMNDPPVPEIRPGPSVKTTGAI